MSPLEGYNDRCILGVLPLGKTVHTSWQESALYVVLTKGIRIDNVLVRCDGRALHLRCYSKTKEQYTHVQFLWLFKNANARG